MSPWGLVVIKHHGGVSSLPSDLEKKNSSPVGVNQVCFQTWNWKHQMTTSTSTIRGHSHWGTGSVLELRACCKHVCPLGPARLRMERSNEKTGALPVAGWENPLRHCRRARSDLPGTEIPQSPPLTSQKWKPAHCQPETSHREVPAASRAAPWSWPSEAHLQAGA